MIYLDHLLQATRGALQNAGTATQFTGFSHDSRQLEPGELFVAVRGERGNGHDYLLDALRKGAGGLLLEARTFSQLSEQMLTTLQTSDCALVVVEDTRLALQAYAQFILARWKPTVIAVTGSVGKTSTKEAIASVLSTRYPTFRSWQNYNDLLGIPLSLGRLEEQHRYAVLELGCDHPGEITELCHLVQPQMGVLTNIQPVQLQYFGSLDQLANELGTLLTALPKDGYCFYNHQDLLLQSMVNTYPPQQQTHLQPFVSLPSHPEVPVQIRLRQLDWDGLKFQVAEDDQELSLETIELSSHLLGRHASATMLAAYQVAIRCGFTPEEASLAIQLLQPLVGRLSPLPGLQGARLLDDTHNASPASLIAGLETLKALTPAQGGGRIAVLGDMLNLGAYEEEAHRVVGTVAAECVDYLIVRGELADILATSALQAGLDSERIIFTSSHEDAAQAVRNLLDNLPTGVEAVVLIKGSEETRMERVTEMLLARPWEASECLVRQTPGWKKTIFRHADRPTWVEIDLNAIGNNTHHLQALVGPHVQILISLKADAYGHGAVKVARTALHNGARMLGVATVTEAIPLREANITAPILVFGYVPLWQMREAIRLGVTITLYSSEAAQALSHAAQELDKTVRVHVKVDTGMGRLGIRWEQSEEIIALVREITALPGLELEGLYTHFAQADASDQSYSLMQLARFQQILALLEEQSLRPPIVHAANSAATLSLTAAHFDLVRPGIAIYGLDPSPEVRVPSEFRPALSFRTQVSQVKWIPAGEGISYGSTYWTTRPTKIAVLPVGYADGFRRGPQNWGYVLIHGQEAPILGRVCMDQCMIDVTDIPHVRVGDEVVLIGRQGEATLTAEKVAERLGTINYEVVAELLARVPRVD
ncbi:alanine racemase [Tengunoibacter tsumagoiensis]|uniref:Multifunctional fusion protein n=1 Tax=Tengunoibacter tsumagoiensis TaxID=2014871 RepID=A0A401ZWW4_9CHLR|nr:alanine racemase [Tengunoibacter tsumagoiensis]GCE11353.1 alanine racemase [Tengunoibacter tsumagoiensis]